MAMSAPRVTVAVPTLGRSPLLEACLASLRAQSVPCDVVLVCPRRAAIPFELEGRGVDRVLETGPALGFAAATNAGWRGSTSEWLAAVNDDVELAPAWLERLLDEGQLHPEAASLQGVNLRHDDSGLADGCGLAWNRWLQAVQIGHLQPAPDEDAAAREIFGVSATAAIYRRAALAGLAGKDGAVFEPRFGSYYEDVDLAVRLRAAGFSARLVPSARARHAGGATGDRHPFRRARLVYGNRLLTLRRALGGGLWVELPLIAVRDAIDAWRRVRRGELAAAAGVAAGWGGALGRLAFISPAKPAITAAALREWEGPS
jgi:GT2 family glycosyltransferase